VPFFIINGEHALSGAQPPEAFLQVLDQIAGRNMASAVH
jgi:predicted DsbA family dithiol-disulfide isomerase